jgi:diketogulonate reductase-like aldo/keto reductase
LSNHQCEYHPYLDQSKLRAKTLAHGMSWTSFCPIGKGAAFDDPVIVAIARTHNKKPSQVIMRWQVQQPGTVAVPKSVHAERIAENFDVFDFSLTDAEMAAISALKKPDGRIVSPPFAPKWDV